MIGPLVASLTMFCYILLLSLLFSESAGTTWFKAFEPVIPSTWNIFTTGHTTFAAFPDHFLKLRPLPIYCTLSLPYFSSYHLSMNILYELFIVSPSLENKL